MRLRALRELGHHVVDVQVCVPYHESRFKRLVPSAFTKLGYPLDLVHANRRLCELSATCHPDIVWIDKGMSITKNTLLVIKQNSPATIVSYNPDDIMQPAGRSAIYLRAIPFYDVHFTTRIPNISELYGFRARRVERAWFAFDKHVHRPLSVTCAEKSALGGPVGFIGTYERDRAEEMRALAQAGVPIRIWGSGWRHLRGRDPNLRIDDRPLYNEEYSKAVCSFDISLGFLRKANRDQHTTRSLEIPACGGFLLAERTEEHLELFEEGREAEFYSSSRELHDKVVYYLKNESARKAIAQAGQRRCLASGYDNHSRLRKMVDAVTVLSCG